MGMDEKLHHQRGLALWERLGHPLDTLTVFVTLSYIVINDYTEQGQMVYIMLSIFSCLFITKDEFIHTKVCSAFEHWLHAVLFILHPMIFLCAGILWKYQPQDEFLNYWAILTGLFMMYQIFRWSIPWKAVLKR